MKKIEGKKLKVTTLYLEEDIVQGFRNKNVNISSLVRDLMEQIKNDGYKVIDQDKKQN